jgi:hypothetical protein
MSYPKEWVYCEVHPGLHVPNDPAVNPTGADAPEGACKWPMFGGYPQSVPGRTWADGVFAEEKPWPEVG